LAALASGGNAGAADDALVAWLQPEQEGRVEMRALPGAGGASQPASRDATATRVPLGSLWKLFVFSYLSESRAEELAYVCSANRSAQAGEEQYCCAPGESVARAQALARSCAPYFSPARLGIAQKDWQAHWKSRIGAPWLLDLDHLNPETEVPVGDLLKALAMIAPQARAEARRALLETGIEGYGREAWPVLGSGMRYKTYSWHRADGSAFGGAAGWLADGTPFWFGARGSSRSALAAWAPQLAAALPAFSVRRWRDSGADAGGAACVDVDFFARYPLRAVWRAGDFAQGKVEAKPGDLKGRFRLEFANGNWLAIASRGDLSLAEGEGGAPVITGRFAINDYVARVIEREGSATQPQAARALAIAARSYLVQNAHFEAGCWRIADSSRTQRVSANAPGDAALAAAWFSDEIVLKGVPVRYHGDAPGANRLAWREALVRAGEGWDFERILAAAYPQATIATLSGREECARLEAAETWLARAIAGWDARLLREPGFEALSAPPKVCALADGHPYSDQKRLRIYARGWRNLDERVTLAHEYLHLAFRFHPNGADENYIERLARRLIES
jgi:uncharacterized protein YfaQ (DUF2300 family)